MHARERSDGLIAGKCNPKEKEKKKKRKSAKKRKSRTKPKAALRTRTKLYLSACPVPLSYLSDGFFVCKTCPSPSAVVHVLSFGSRGPALSRASDAPIVCVHLLRFPHARSLLTMTTHYRGDAERQALIDQSESRLDPCRASGAA